MFLYLFPMFCGRCLALGWCKTWRDDLRHFFVPKSFIYSWCKKMPKSSRPPAVNLPASASRAGRRSQAEHCFRSHSQRCLTRSGKKRSWYDACSNVASEDRAHNLRIMRPTRYQLRYCHPVMKAIFVSISLSNVLWPLFGFRMVKNMAG